MGNGISNKGINPITIKFDKDADFGWDGGSVFIIKKLEKVIGDHFKVDIDPYSSYTAFRRKIEYIRVNIPFKNGKKEIEIIFTLKKGYKWDYALVDPYNSLLVQSRDQVEKDAQYVIEDAQAAIEKQQRLTQYNVRIEQQKADDESKGIIRDASGKIILNIYESQHWGSDYANKLNVSFSLYAKSGFNEKYLTVVIDDYYYLLSSQIDDLREFDEFLMSESSSALGKFVTWTGAIDRPENLDNALKTYNDLLQKIIKEFKKNNAAEKVLEDLGKIESYCTYASGVLKKFYEESIKHSQRIALAIQIAQMAIPIGAAAKGLEMLCIVAAEKFSFEVTKKVVYGTDVSWTKTIVNTGLDTVYDTVLRFGVSSLVSKIPVINGIRGIKGDVIKIAMNTVTTEVANSIGEAFKGATFGEALSNLHKRLTNYEVWVSAIVNHTSYKYFGKYLDIQSKQTSFPVSLMEDYVSKSDTTKKPASKDTKDGPVVKPRGGALKKSSTLLLPIVLLFGFAKTANAGVDPQNNKPTISESNSASEPKTIPHSNDKSDAESIASNREVLNKGISSKSIFPKASIANTSNGVDSKTRGIDNPISKAEQAKKVDPQKGTAQPSEVSEAPNSTPKPSGGALGILPVVGATKSRRKLKTADDKDSGVELMDAYKRIGFTKKRNSEGYKTTDHGSHQVNKTRKDYEYYKKIKKSDGNDAQVEPDDLEVAEDKKKLNIVEYKNFKDREKAAEIYRLIKKNKGILDKKIYAKLKASKHFVYFDEKFNQMMNYVELVAKYPAQLDKIIYRCSDEITRLIYDDFVKANLFGFLNRSPSLKSFIDKIEIIVDP